MENNKKPSQHSGLWNRFLKCFAIETESISVSEKVVATLGGMIGITVVAFVSYHVTGFQGAALIVPSMGASAVLLFAVPHGKLSQPWPLIGGNLISALIGVSCYKVIPDIYLASGLAVGLAIGAMHILRCVHPPGGATALAAVIGGPVINNLGFNYIVSPILINVIVILLTAVLFNSVFPWRRYPAAVMMRFTEKRPEAELKKLDLVDKKDIELAMSDMDLVMDVTIEDLQRLIQLSLDHARRNKLTPDQIKLNHFYTNGKHGPEWCVRRIIDESVSGDPNKDMVIYRVVEGQGFNSADSCTRAEFAQWAAREVFVNSG